MNGLKFRPGTFIRSEGANLCHRDVVIDFIDERAQRSMHWVGEYLVRHDCDFVGDCLCHLNPINRTATRTGIYAYKVEPYVLAADIYAEPPHVRRGGWT